MIVVDFFLGYVDMYCIFPENVWSNKGRTWSEKWIVGKTRVYGSREDVTIKFRQEMILEQGKIESITFKK